MKYIFYIIALTFITSCQNGNNHNNINGATLSDSLDSNHQKNINNSIQSRYSDKNNNDSPKRLNKREEYYKKIIGTWVSVEDSNVMYIFTANTVIDKDSDFSDTFSYIISDSCFCTSTKVDSNIYFLNLIGEERCYEIDLLDSNMTLFYYTNNNHFVFKKR